jgi:hypothetical protein
MGAEYALPPKIAAKKIPKRLSDLGWFGLFANTADLVNRISRQENG